MFDDDASQRKMIVYGDTLGNTVLAPWVYDAAARSQRRSVAIVSYERSSINKDKKNQR